MSKKFLLLIFSFLAFSIFLKSNFALYAQTETPTPTSDQASEEKLIKLQNEIKELQTKISQSQTQQKTLSSQINVMDNQIRLTQLRINSTKQEIATITQDIKTTIKKISTLEASLTNLTKILVNRIVVTYQIGSIRPLEVLLSSSDASDFFTRANYLRIIQAHDKQLIYETQQAKNDYANQKDIFEVKKTKVESLQKQLESYNTQLDQEKNNKQSLLAVTKNDEERYQKLLQEAQSQIQAFKSFSLSKTGGSSSILPPQASPDGWYYNQRDERWGRNRMGASYEQVWNVGCLITSVAMVMKKHGQNVTPAEVAGNTSYFFSDTAYILLPWAGGKFSSVWGLNQSVIDNKLSSGEPVIVGVRAGVYGQHFIVLKSGSSGNYIMNDPWYGPDLKFTDYYSTGQIFQYGYYNG